MSGSTSYEAILNYMPEKLREVLSAVDHEKLSGLMEVRIRVGSGVYFVYPDKISYLMKNGELCSVYGGSVYNITSSAIRSIVERLCHYSIHSCEKQLSEGFFVIENGVRVGVSGGYSMGVSPVLNEFTSLNFRISRAVKGCADEIFSRFYDKSIIICGGVNSGKTTVLRELCRLTGSFRKVTLIDERNEISCLLNGIPQNDVGIMTDIIGNCSRSEGILNAIRTLSPDYIFCDEIASISNAEAIISGSGCGVKFVVTAHGNTYDEVIKRNEIARLISSGSVDSLVFLSGASAPSVVREVRRIKSVD